VFHENTTVLLLALRGGKENSAEKVMPGQLISGTLGDVQTPNPIFQKIGSYALHMTQLLIEAPQTFT
jgi:hypothetical protein